MKRLQNLPSWAKYLAVAFLMFACGVVSAGPSATAPDSNVAVSNSEGEPQIVEVTRLVEVSTEGEPIEVEVTRLVEVEVTRLVEVETIVEVEPQPTEAPPANAGLGETAVLDGYGLTAVEVVDPATPGIFTDVPDGQRLVSVIIILENIDNDEPIQANPLFGQLVDDDGFVYNAELAGTDNDLEAFDLQKGQKAQGGVSFLIPENATPAQFQYVEGLFGGAVMTVDLR